MLRLEVAVHQVAVAQVGQRVQRLLGDGGDALLVGVGVRVRVRVGVGVRVRVRVRVGSVADPRKLVQHAVAAWLRVGLGLGSGSG